jgi:hypothetical protein
MQQMKGVDASAVYKYRARARTHTDRQKLISHFTCLFILLGRDLGPPELRGT